MLVWMLFDSMLYWRVYGRAPHLSKLQSIFGTPQTISFFFSTQTRALKNTFNILIQKKKKNFPKTKPCNIINLTFLSVVRFLKLNFVLLKYPFIRIQAIDFCFLSFNLPRITRNFHVLFPKIIFWNSTFISVKFE